MIEWIVLGVACWWLSLGVWVWMRLLLHTETSCELDDDRDLSVSA